MTVVEVPKRNPQISGSDPMRDYSVGDTLNLTCVSAPSNPPSQLEWRLNGRPVGSSGHVQGGPSGRGLAYVDFKFEVVFH